jgi:ABC-type transport system substrate-binding protein
MIVLAPSFFSKSRVKLVVLGLAVLLLTSFGAGSMPFTSGASTTSCPASDQMNWTLFGGAPANFNLLGAYNPSGYDIAFMVFPLGISPPPFPNGTLDLQNSATNYVTHNSNFTIWTFNTKPGLKWSDGQPINASTLLLNFGPTFALNASVDPVGASSLVTKEYAANSTEAVFVLNQSEAHFDELLSPTVDTALYPPQFIAQGASYSGVTNGTLVGDGPFYIGSYQAGSTSLTLLRNPYYTPLPQICQINVNFAESESQTSTYLLSGASDFAQLPASNLPSFVNNPDFTLIPEIPGGSGLLAMVYNVTSVPYNQLGFRQALLYSVNQSDIEQNAYFGYGTTAYNEQGFIPSSTSLWYSPNQTTYSYNPTKALSLLHSLGYTTDSSGNLHYPNGTAVSLTFYVQNNYAENLLAANIVQKDLQNIGIKTTLAPDSAAAFFHLKFTGQLNYALMMAWVPGQVFGSPYFDSQPACDTGMTFAVCPQTGGNFMGNSTSNTQYWANVTALSKTDNVTLEKQYLANIQSLASINLPELNLQIPQQVFALRTSKFGNIGGLKTGISYFGQNWVPTAFAEITPVGSLSSTSTQSGTSSFTSSITTTSATASLPTSATTSQNTGSASSSTSSSSSSTLTLVAIAVVIIIVIGAVAGVFLSRRRGAGQSTP